MRKTPSTAQTSSIAALVVPRSRPVLMLSLETTKVFQVLRMAHLLAASKDVEVGGGEF